MQIPLDFAVVSLHIHGLLLATAPCLENYSTTEKQKNWGRGGGTHGGQVTAPVRSESICLSHVGKKWAHGILLIGQPTQAF